MCVALLQDLYARRYKNTYPHKNVPNYGVLKILSFDWAARSMNVAFTVAFRLFFFYNKILLIAILTRSRIKTVYNNMVQVTFLTVRVTTRRAINVNPLHSEKFVV